MQTTKSRLSKDALEEGILRGDRVILAQAITLTESSLPGDQALATTLFERILPKTGNSIRVGITGVPGVGKSTFIESFGTLITAAGKKVAVLTVDPSSQITGGSILGDKTRMEQLARNPNAFIRPTPAGHTLGGVAKKTREAMLLCEAAGYDVILVETVGVGQSEVAVKSMVDFFVLLMLAGAGDELQGIKKGIMEMADAVIITKADGQNISHAKQAQAEYSHALHLFAPAESGWRPKVVTASALTGTGIEPIWKMINDYHTLVAASGFLHTNRRKQNIVWFHEAFNHLLRSELQSFDSLKEKMKQLEEDVANQNLPSEKAAVQLLEAYRNCLKHG